MHWYLIVLRNGHHFFATRRYLEKSFVIDLAMKLHELMPDATIKLYYSMESIQDTTLYKGDSNE